jgi:hypothetical protein
METLGASWGERMAGAGMRLIKVAIASSPLEARWRVRSFGYAGEAQTPTLRL